MAGWFEAFGHFMGGAAPAFDRYAALRQLDVENQFKRRQQEMQQQQETIRSKVLQDQSAREAAESAKKMELLDMSILGQKQKAATEYRLPGMDMSPEDAQNFRGPLQLGGLVQSENRYTPNLDLSALGMENLPTTMPDFSEQIGLAPVDQTKTSHDVYSGTPAQAEQLRQRRLMMAIAGGLDPVNRGRVLMGEAPTHQPRQPNPPATPFSNPMETIIDGRSVWADPRTRQVIPELGTPPPHSSGGSGGAGKAPLNDQQMSNIDEAAKAVVERRMSPSQAASLYGGGVQGAAIKGAIATRVAQLDPSFDWQNAEANYQFGKAPGTQSTIKFLDNVKGTIPMVRAMVKKMEMSDYKFINKMDLAIRGQTGDTDAAAFDFMTTLLADELGKILQGGGTGNSTSDAKLKQAKDLMATEMSPSQWQGVLDTAEHMLSVRRDTLTKGTHMDPNRNENIPVAGEAGGGGWTFNPVTKQWKQGK